MSSEEGARWGQAQPYLGDPRSPGDPGSPRIPGSPGVPGSPRVPGSRRCERGPPRALGLDFPKARVPGVTTHVA